MSESDGTRRLKHLMLTRLRAKHFSLLTSIADQGSIHRAAAMHGLSQPGVSKLLGEIEAILELPLFERSASGTVPTIYGLRASKTFRAILTEIDYLAQELDVIRAGGGGIIRVGVINFISRTMLSNAILQLRNAGHRFVVHVVNGNTDTLVSALHALELDCVVARKVETGGKEEVRFTPVYQQAPCLVFRSGTVGAAAPHQADLFTRMSWILPPRGTPGRLEFDRVLARLGVVEPNTVVESSDLDLIYNLIRNEPEVCAILPSDIGAELEIRGGVQFELFEGAFEYPKVGIIELPRVARDPNVDLFCDALSSAADTHGNLVQEVTP